MLGLDFYLQDSCSELHCLRKVFHYAIMVLAYGLPFIIQSIALFFIHEHYMVFMLHNHLIMLKEYTWTLQHWNILKSLQRAAH